MNYFPLSVLLGGQRKQIIQRLKGNGIITILDYMKEKRHKLREKLISQKMLQSDVDQLFNEIEQLISEVRQHEQNLFKQLSEKSAIQDIKYLQFEKFSLFPIQKISLVLGDINTGKTTLLLQTILQYQLTNQQQQNIYYFDCSNSLSAKRIQQIYTSKINQTKVEELLSQIQYKTFDQITEFEDAIKQINNKSIIIIDGLLTLYSEFSNEIYHLQHIINELFRYFVQLTKTQENTFLISIRSIQDSLQNIQGTKFDQFINCYVSTIVHLLNCRQNKIMKVHKGLNQNLPYDDSIFYELNESGFILLQQ